LIIIYLFTSPEPTPIHSLSLHDALPISLASKQQVRGTEGVAHAMQIISNITRQTSQGTRGTVATVSQLVKLSDHLNEALAQFRAGSKVGSSAATAESDRPIPAGAAR